MTAGPLPVRPVLHVRRVHLLRWTWWLTAGQYGATIFGPHYARSEKTAWERAWAEAHRIHDARAPQSDTWKAML